MLVIEGSRRMKTPRVINIIEAYWEAQRPDGGLPSRVDIDPSGIEDVLGYSLLLERRPTGDVVFRVAGEFVEELFANSLRRVSVSVLFSRECQTQINSNLKKVFDEPGILRAEMISSANLMRPELVAHLLVMPLQSKPGDVDLAFGGLFVDGIVGKPPRQFTQVRQNVTRVVVGSDQHAVVQKKPLLGVAESSTPFAHQKGRPTYAGRPNLTLINGGRD